MAPGEDGEHGLARPLAGGALVLNTPEEVNGICIQPESATR